MHAFLYLEHTMLVFSCFRLWCSTRKKLLVFFFLILFMLSCHFPLTDSFYSFYILCLKWNNFDRDSLKKEERSEFLRAVWYISLATRHKLRKVKMINSISERWEAHIAKSRSTSARTKRRRRPDDDARITDARRSPADSSPERRFSKTRQIIIFRIAPLMCVLKPWTWTRSGR